MNKQAAIKAVLNVYTKAPDNPSLEEIATAEVEALIALGLLKVDETEDQGEDVLGFTKENDNGNS